MNIKYAQNLNSSGYTIPSYVVEYLHSRMLTRSLLWQGHIYLVIIYGELCVCHSTKKLVRKVAEFNGIVTIVKENRSMELQEDQQHLTYVNNPEEIFREIRNSMIFGNVLGIFAISLGPIMIMTAVDDIIEIKNDKLIIIKETDLLGIKVPEEQILLSEIVRVHPFKTLFDDPFHVQLRESRKYSGPGS